MNSPDSPEAAKSNVPPALRILAAFQPRFSGGMVAMPRAGVGGSARAEVTFPSNKARLGLHGREARQEPPSKLTSGSFGTNLPAMIAHMVFLAVVASESGVRHRRVSLPLIECLIDNRRYFREADLEPARGEDLRPQCRPKLGKVLAARPVRATAAERAAERRDYVRRREDRDLDELARILGAAV